MFWLRVPSVIYIDFSPLFHQVFQPELDPKIWESGYKKNMLSDVYVIPCHSLEKFIIIVIIKSGDIVSIEL